MIPDDLEMCKLAKINSLVFKTENEVVELGNG
jgi:hypothetical protein